MIFSELFRLTNAPEAVFLCYFNTFFAAVNHYTPQPNHLPKFNRYLLVDLRGAPALSVYFGE